MIKDIHSHISFTIKRELKKRDWTPHRLWRETGIPRSSLYFMIENKNNWSIESLLKVAEVFKMGIDELLFHTDSEINKELALEVDRLHNENKKLREELSTYKAVLNMDALKKIKAKTKGENK